MLPLLHQVYPRFLQLAAQSKDPVERLQWVVTYFIAGVLHGAVSGGKAVKHLVHARGLVIWLTECCKLADVILHCWSV